METMILKRPFVFPAGSRSVGVDDVQFGFSLAGPTLRVQIHFSVTLERGNIIGQTDLESLERKVGAAIPLNVLGKIFSSPLINCSRIPFPLSK